MPHIKEAHIKEVIVLILVLLVAIQSASAISNVQHSVDGNKITLTYQGTPPYWINIRGDTNIGQNDGFLWAKTYLNSFSFDASLATNPSKKFYYGVKDTQWSTTNNFLIGQNQNRNMKDLSKFSSKNAFLVSDEDWRRVMTLVPLAVWTNSDNTVTKYPLLIYHKENNAFDIDSIYYFFEQYNPNKITYFEGLPSSLNSLLRTSFNTEQKQDILYYWAEYVDVVYVEDNYELALLASTYASLINAPLIIKGYNDNIDLSQKNVICVGNPSPDCNEKYNLDQLQKKYASLTGTDKILLVNPNDLQISVIEYFSPENSSSPIRELYSKTSLTAPILASAKKELIIFSKSTDYQTIFNDIKNQIYQSGISPSYLTIMASPDAIQMTKEVTIEEDYFTFPGQIEEIDNYIYGNPDGKFFQKFAVGRIFGITSSDISSYVARVLFYYDISQGLNKYALTAGDIGIEYGHLISIKKMMDLAGLTGENLIDVTDNRNNYHLDINKLKDKDLIVYSGHGSSWGLQSMSSANEDLKGHYFSPSLFLTQACSSCDFYGAGSNKAWLFCANMLRKGMIGYIGGVTISGAEISPPYEITQDLIESGSDLGTLMKNYKNKNVIYHSSLDDYKRVAIANGAGQLKNHEYFYILLGDPTFKFPRKSYLVDDPGKIKIFFEKTTNSISIIIPEQTEKVNITSYANNMIYRMSAFVTPFGKEISSIARGHENVYDLDGSLEWNNAADYASYIFHIDMPDGMRINNISGVLITDKDSSRELIELPIYGYNGAVPTNPKLYFAFFFNDPYISNRYWFSVYEILGGNPLIVAGDKINSYQIKLELT